MTRQLEQSFCHSPDLNLDTRLKQFYQDDYELRLDNTKEGGFRVRLRVPSH